MAAAAVAAVAAAAAAANYSFPLQFGRYIPFDVYPPGPGVVLPTGDTWPPNRWAEPKPYFGWVLHKYSKQ